MECVNIVCETVLKAVLNIVCETVPKTDFKFNFQKKLTSSLLSFYPHLVDLQCMCKYCM